MTYADRIPAPRPVPTTRHRLDDARSHALEVERDDLRIQVGRAEADNRAMMRDRDQALAERDAARNDAKQAAQLAAFRQGVIDRHRQELGAAGDVLAVVRDAAERIDRALAAYDTTPREPAEREDAPHEDPARLREQLAEAHADCARYATERDEARAALANPLRKAAEHLRLLAEDHAADSLGFGIGWAADALDAWANNPDEDAATPVLGSLPPRAQDDDLADRLAGRLADALGRLEEAAPGIWIGRFPRTDVERWRALLAEHADRSLAEGWKREANRLDTEREG